MLGRPTVDRQGVIAAGLGGLALGLATVGFAAMTDPLEPGWPWWPASSGALGASLGTSWRTYGRKRDAGEPDALVSGVIAGAGMFAAFLCWLVVIAALHPIASGQAALVTIAWLLLLMAAIVGIPAAVLWERTPDKRRRVLVGTLAMYAALALLAYFALASGPDLVTYGWLGLQAPPWLEWVWLLLLASVALGVAAIIAYNVPAKHYGRTEG